MYSRYGNNVLVQNFGAIQVLKIQALAIHPNLNAINSKTLAKIMCVITILVPTQLLENAGNYNVTQKTFVEMIT